MRDVSELVARLRFRLVRSLMMTAAEIYSQQEMEREEAADAIEAQAREIAAMTARAEAALRREADLLDGNEVNRKALIAYNASTETRVRAAEAKVARLAEALDGLHEAITASDEIGDRCLRIQGSTANLRWLIEATDEARAALAEIGGAHG